MVVCICLTVPNLKGSDELLMKTISDALSSYVETRTPVDKFLKSNSEGLPPEVVAAKTREITERVAVAMKLQKAQIAIDRSVPLGV